MSQQISHMKHYTYYVSSTLPVSISPPVEPELLPEPEDPPKPQFRKRVKGFYQSQEREEDELMEVPTDCPNLTTGGIGPIIVGEF